MTTREIFQVQARLSGVTPEGWHSSRQAKTMYVAAIDEIDAVRMVSDLCCEACEDDYPSRRLCPYGPESNGAA